MNLIFDRLYLIWTCLREKIKKNCKRLLLNAIVVVWSLMTKIGYEDIQEKLTVKVTEICQIQTPLAVFRI
jgi:hypothetical protein